MKKILGTMLLGCATLAVSAQTNGQEGTENGTANDSLGTATLAGIQVNGQKLPKFNKNNFKYTYNVYYQEAKDYKEGCITYTLTPGDSSTVAISYNPATRIADVKVSAVKGSATNTYKIRFSRLFHQLEDAGFENYTGGNEPLYGWYSFASATGAANFAKDMSPQPQSVEGGANGSKRAVMLKSIKVFGLVNANGNMTTGAINMGSPSATDPSNYNYTNFGELSNNLPFQGKPDAVEFYAKYKAGKNNKGKCGNANFILHKDGVYSDPEVDSLKSIRFAKASQLIKESTDWVKYTVPFVYDGKASGSPKYLLASVTTNPVPGESSGDELYFDEVKFIYNSTLSALSVKGAEFDFKEDSLNYDLRGSRYFIDGVSYTTTGIGSYVNKQFDAATGLYTFTVKGNDYTTNPENITTYTLQFDVPDTVQVNDIKVYGKSIENFDAKTTNYMVLNQDYEEGCIACTTSDAANSQVVVDYNPATRCATIKVVSLIGGFTATYTLKFDQAIYQFEDASFEKYTEGIEPLYGWHSFNSATGAMAAFGKGLSPNPSSVADGANGSKRSVMLYSKNVILANANGNLTTGIINMGSYIPTDASNHNFTDTKSLNHALRFAGRPDSVIFYAKFKAGATNSAKVGRANFILHDECNYKDPEDSTHMAEQRIGKASQLIAESKDWTKYVVPFVYDKEQTETQYLLASVTTNPVPGESAGDTLYFDEVQFVYNNGIASMQYADAELNFATDKTTYNLEGYVYEPGLLVYALNGKGATAEESYNNETGVLTITVKGNDFVVNSDNVTIYTLQFDVQTGVEAITKAGNVNVYGLNGILLRHNVKAENALQGLPSGVYVINGKKVVK